MRSSQWRRLTFGVVCTLAAVAALPATGANAEDLPAAAECQWLSTDLPLPAGFTNGSVSDTDGGNRFAGTVWNQRDNYCGVHLITRVVR